MKKVLTAKILSNKQIVEEHFVMELESLFLAENSVPGQFVSLRVKEQATTPLLRVPLGVHKINDNSISVLYKTVGQKTEILSAKKEGETINVLGPLGNGFDLVPATEKKYSRAVLVSGGHGIAPLYALTKELISKDIKVIFYIGACEAKHILLEPELTDLGAEVHIATECGARGHQGYITELVKDHIEKDASRKAETIIYACGPQPMLEALSDHIKDLNIPAQVSLDAYMACGIGACLGCAVKTIDGYKMVCKDGPVFDCREIIWRETKQN